LTDGSRRRVGLAALLVPVIGISLDVAQHHNPAANRKFPGIRAGLVNMRVSSAAYP